MIEPSWKMAKPLAVPTHSTAADAPTHVTLVMNSMAPRFQTASEILRGETVNQLAKVCGLFLIFLITSYLSRPSHADLARPSKGCTIHYRSANSPIFRMQSD